MTGAIDLRTCRTCGLRKTLDEFSKHKNSLDGMNRECRACSNTRARQWRDQKKDRINAEKRANYKINKQAILAQQKDYYARNRAAILLRQKPDPQLNRERTKKWAAANPEKRRAQLLRRTENLTDYYIKDRLIAAGLSRSSITPELINLKRQQLALHRLAKEMADVAASQKESHESI